MHNIRINLVNCILLLTLVASVSWAYAGPLVVHDRAEYPLAGHLEMLVDPGGTLSFPRILARDNQLRFKPLSGFLTRGYTRDTVWLRFSLIHEEPFPHDAILRLWPPYLDKVDVYIQEGDDPSAPGSYRLHRLGDRRPVSERPIIAADFAVPLFLPRERAITAYIRVQTTSSLNLYCSVHTEKDYITHGSNNVAMNGGYLSITLVVFMINVVLYLRLRDRLYLYFSLYTLSLFVCIFPGSGIMTLIWPSLVHLLSDYLVGMGAASSLLFFSLFGNRLFSAVDKPWVHHYFMLLSLIAGATALSVPIGFYNRLAPWLFIGSLSSIILLTWLSFRETRRGTSDAFLYLAAFGASNIGYGVQFLRLLGVVPIAWWNMHAVEISSILNMVLMTLAMTERVNRAEKRALEAALSSEQHAVILAERITTELYLKQQKLEEALAAERKAFESQVRFVEVISHEYRTPLAIIRANLDIMEMKSGSTECECKYRNNMEKIKRALARLVEVLEISLGTEQLDRSRLQLQPLRLTDFLTALEQESRGLWDGRCLEFLQYQDEATTVQADPAMLKTALFNLIDNACKYSAEDKPVIITCTADKFSATIAVQDYGSGIATGEYEEIFAKHFRGANSGHTRGIGVGLYLVRSIVDLHAGKVDLASSRNGTTFRILLPLKPVAGKGVTDLNGEKPWTSR